MASGALNPFNAGSSLWCKICKTRGEDRSEDYYLLQKYVHTPINIHYKFYKQVGHDEINCWAYKLMMEYGANTYRMKEEEHGQEENIQHIG